MDTKSPAALESIYAPIQAEMRRLDGFLRDEFGASEPFIHELSQHIACFRGKQIRPALLFLATRLVGARPTADVVKIGAVLELVHTATLVHDDLLDGAAMRRRVETVHRRWGNRPAILIGDFIYSRAFQLSTEVEGMAAILSATTHEICEGELLQIGSRHEPDITEDLYFEIIRKKTAILHGVACEIAGRLAGLDEDRVELLRRIGLDLGMAFQVVDDCLDYAGTEEVVGKSLGTDLHQGKLTLPLMYLRDGMAAPERDWLRRALRGPLDAQSEARIHDLVRANGVLTKSFARAESFVQSAKSSLLELAVVGDPRAVAARESLELAADYVLRRDR